MNPGVTRSQLLSSGLRGGAALLATGSVLGALADGAAAAPPSGALGTLATGDLTYVRLLIGVELLAVDFYTHAVGSGHLHAERLADARVALINESEHYTYLAAALTSAGGSPLTAADINFSYPAGSFYTAASVIGLAVVLELLSVGAYLGAAGNLSSGVLQTAVAQITANEAQHLGAFSISIGNPGFHDAFPGPLTIAEVSNELATYTS